MKADTGISAHAIGEAIRKLREKLGLTQEQFNAKLGGKLRGLQRWERGVSIISGDYLVKILMLCPDAATREQFLLDISGKADTIPSSPKSAAPIRETADIRAHDHSPIREMLPDGRIKPEFKFPGTQKEPARRR